MRFKDVICTTIITSLSVTWTRSSNAQQVCLHEKVWTLSFSLEKTSEAWGTVPLAAPQDGYQLLLTFSAAAAGPPRGRARVTEDPRKPAQGGKNVQSARKSGIETSPNWGSRGIACISAKTKNSENVLEILWWLQAIMWDFLRLQQNSENEFDGI